MYKITPGQRSYIIDSLKVLIMYYETEEETYRDMREGGKSHNYHELIKSTNNQIKELEELK